MGGVWGQGRCPFSAKVGAPGLAVARVCPTNQRPLLCAAKQHPAFHTRTPVPPPPNQQAVNGILIPGGAQDLRPGQPFFDTVSQLVDLAIAANDKGSYFPVGLLF